MTQGRSPQLPAHPSAEENGGATASLFSYRPPPFMRRAGLSLLSVALGTLIALLAMEAVLRFLPVNEGVRP